MGIFSRARDIIQANVNDLLDRAEDPVKTIRLAIREMDETLIEVRASAARIIADQKDIQRTVLKLDEARLLWQEKAELALSKGREDLATAALIEKQKVGEIIRQLRDEMEMLSKQLRAFGDDIDKLEAKLHEARSRENMVMARMDTADKRVRIREMLRGPRVEDAFSRFELIERRADLAEAKGDAYDLSPLPKSWEQELSGQHAQNEVAAELEALKAKVKQQKDHGNG